jgi:micrococcal nuclease
VRLLQVDAPELTDDCYGREAARVLADILPEGTRVRLVGDPELDERDTYGRLLRYVVVDETEVNVELVRRGAASPYFFRGERGEHADELLDAVDEARAERRGYWGACPGARLNTGLGSLTGAR